MDADGKYKLKILIRQWNDGVRLDSWQEVPYGLLKEVGIEIPDGTTWSEAWEICGRIGLDKDCIEYGSDRIVVSAKPKIKQKNGKYKQIGHTPWEYENVKFGEVDDNEGHYATRFDDCYRDKAHVKKHAKSLGLTPKEYRRKAKEFANKPLTNTMEEVTIENGFGDIKIFRYDYATNECGGIGWTGEISTFFGPDDGWNYWENEVIKRYGKKGR